MSSSASKRAGLLFVNSKITDEALTPELFTKWYNEVHVPDILLSSGIKSAFRYEAIPSFSTDRPYLALYPLEDVDFLESKEFFSIPGDSDILPKSGSSFDLASFDVRPCIHLKTYENKQAAAGPAPYILLSSFNVTGGDAEIETLLEEGKLPILSPKVDVRRTRLYKTNFTEKNTIEAAGKIEVARYLALVELENQEAVHGLDTMETSFGAKVAAFKLLKAFGNTDKVYFE